MERIQPPGIGSEEAAAESVPWSRDPARLPLLISEAQQAPDSDKLGLARQINALLVDMRAPGNEAAEAKAILKALDLQSLEGLVDSAGRSCRAEAVETLLACGFPYALEVSPDDLDHRQQMAERGRFGPLWLAVLALTVAGALLGLASWQSTALQGFGDWSQVSIWVLVLIGAAVQQLVRASMGSGRKPKP